MSGERGPGQGFRLKNDTCQLNSPSILREEVEANLIQKIAPTGFIIYAVAIIKFRTEMKFILSWLVILSIDSKR
ncbi:hypothetical protein CT0861_08207 [Colletotrichum tofieldiae]|uniref:Uncharacterized protein n=1 Tax=Colletotrichum tofieldiae TaxID=708197 RepID=A0A166QT61_9PEZI|nr:hypothetical protein CT0861_08207 [Colletotrichum tofieldiae]